MITHLRLRNFKSHCNTHIEMRPLTLIAGVNNCGKSSLLQSLLLLRQSSMNNSLKDGLNLNTPLVSIGTGDDALYKLSEDGIIEIGVNDNGEDLDFTFNAENAGKETFIPLADKTQSIDNDKLESHALFNNNFQYLSAERWGGRSDFPADSYNVNTKRQLSKENGQGELLGHFLHTYRAEETFDYLNGKDEKLELLKQVELWEKRISANLTIDVQQRPDSNGYTVFYGSGGTGDVKNIEGLKANNVGYGVSYSLPIVAALLSAAPGALILVENPEAHLHPDGIAELTKLMCLVAQRGVQVVVETHSDHVINGTLVNCKRFEKGEPGIERNNVAIYYLSGQDERHAAIMERIMIEEGGFIDYQPRGFFDRIERDRYFILGE